MVKYGAFSAVIISALVGINLDYWLDPIPLVNRILHAGLIPGVMARRLFLPPAADV